MIRIWSWNGWKVSSRQHRPKTPTLATSIQDPQGQGFPPLSVCLLHIHTHTHTIQAPAKSILPVLPETLPLIPRSLLYSIQSKQPSTAQSPSQSLPSVIRRLPNAPQTESSGWGTPANSATAENNWGTGRGLTGWEEEEPFGNPIPVGVVWIPSSTKALCTYSPTVL